LSRESPSPFEVPAGRAALLAAAAGRAAGNAETADITAGDADAGDADADDADGDANADEPDAGDADAGDADAGDADAGDADADDDADADADADAEAEAAGCGGVDAFAVLPGLPASIAPITSPGLTVWPTFAAWAASTPAAGDGSCTVILSVSSSATASSATTESPTSLSQRETTASVIDSPSWGTTRSAMTTAYSLARGCATAPAA